MNIRAVLCAASGAVLTTLPQAAVGQQGVKIGALSCEVSGGLGLIIASSKEMNCLFTSGGGQSEPYSGTIRKFGLDIGATDKGVLAWDVFAPSSGPERGALAGDYVGVDASATIGAKRPDIRLHGGFGGTRSNTAGFATITPQYMNAERVAASAQSRAGG